MRFPEAHPHAVQLVRSYDGFSTSRELVECAIDFFIFIEPDSSTLEELTKGDKIYADNLIKYKEEIKNANKIVRNFGEQLFPATLENMQDVFYSFSNSRKYLNTREISSIARLTLSTNWTNINGWLD